MDQINPDLPRVTRRSLASSLRTPGGQLVLYGAVGAAVVGLAAFALVGAEARAIGLSFAGYTVGLALVLVLLRRGFPHDSIGLCNKVTLARLALTSALLAPLAGSAAPWVVFAIAALALGLDGLDGWLARRDGLSSDFGARFDMEVDSALALILALNAWAAGTAGAIVLLIGLPRYAFALAARALPWLDRAAPERFSRKLVCVLQIATLIALQLPLVAASVANPVVALVAAALIWSFGRDILWLWRTKP
ncbi:CDP-alcohol phosphatidyltransferase family protein [Roseicyclus mahoneyensis]|jgi:phosphatidylglycerophosphate synthase|uniref:Phosphatidylglycerophosphate synthase n=1 Tax=Roseicyclus mahoneyensis TaxID=164332 RepID=A0A316GS91_9RHOB|nr:CDP-alcohol phosphatidyltransferase family protein [Roseicyclus mahoneyensis]PWK62942.1 phosphatidylglycerophosphate synthase [Roseicyclus mahoneyensis]